MEVTILSRAELVLLWVIALSVPPVAHIATRVLSRAIGVDPRGAMPRVMLCTGAAVGVLLFLTSAHFAAASIEEDSVTLRYAFPPTRSVTLPRTEIAEVRLREGRFPRQSYSVAIESKSGAVYQSVGVTTAGLAPLYELMTTFHPGETPYVAAR